MNRALAIGLPLVAGLALLAAPCPAGELPEPEASIVRVLPRGADSFSGTGHGTANSSCAGAECDTVHTRHLTDFVKRSERGICRPSKSR